jgi:hypothetical protein
MKNMVGAALQFGITNVVAKNPETIKGLGMAFFQWIKRKIKSPIPPETPAI